jgi:hypothetical protein
VTKASEQAREFYLLMRHRADQVQGLSDEMATWSREMSGYMALPEPLRRSLSAESVRLASLADKLRHQD